MCVPNEPVAAGSKITSITYDDYLPPTRYLPPGALAKALEVWKHEFLGGPEPSTPPEADSDAKLNAKPCTSDPVSDDGSRSDDLLTHVPCGTGMAAWAPRFCRPAPNSCPLYFGCPRFANAVTPNLAIYYSFLVA